MKHYIRLSVALLIATSLTGCVIAIGNDAFDIEENWQHRQNRNVEYIHHLSLGQSMSSVESEIGDPDFVESFLRDGDEFELFYYRTQKLHDDGKTTIDETTPLVFVDRQLVGWGRSAIDKATL